jgi:hypothetical protein
MARRSAAPEAPLPDAGSGPETLAGFIRRALPRGTRVLGEAPRLDWASPPDWPPNLFAVAALVIERLDLLGWWDASTDPARNAMREARQAGRHWRDDPTPPAELVGLWSALLADHGALVLADFAALPPASRQALVARLVQLVAMADEASAGAGYAAAGVPAKGEREAAKLSRAWVRNVIRAFALASARGASRDRREIRPLGTLTIGLSPDVGVVLPKSRTPNVGCTLRTLSHNLALLPPETSVAARWRVQPREQVRSGAGFNVLLVPFPYQLDTAYFHRTRLGSDPSWAYFGVHPRWLPGSGTAAARRKAFCDWVETLIEAAGREGPVHAVVFPELSLTAALFQALARRLEAMSARDDGPGVELLVAGVCLDQFDAPCNRVMVQVYHPRDGGGPPSTLAIDQGKHHRWKLDRGQLATYGLAASLHEADAYWEDFEVGRREVNFHPFRDGSVLCCLICEDLARLDPCQPVVRAVGPNLIVALLMDSPQLASRWPARYATVLAEDPGSAVLTLTSLGMMRLSERGGYPRSAVIGLWKSATQPSTEVKLPDGAHAVLLALHASHQSERTIDGRHDDGTAIHWSLESQVGVRLPVNPPWLKI